MADSSTIFFWTELKVTQQQGSGSRKFVGKMNVVERSRRWKNLKQRLGFKGMGCLGITWSSATQTITILEQQEGEGEGEGEGTRMQGQRFHHDHHQVTTRASSAAASGMMNLAAALEAERNLRGGGEDVVGPAPKNAGGNTTVKSLMMLIEETDGDDWKKKNKEISDVAAGGGSDWMCCVCMERNKGAAFIPCGHTFCRICSRELWLNRGSCPVCNRSILEILDIF
ncbi:hypothetical protein ACOSQ2_002788 [Xanthoceras sorbifolium]